MQRQHAAFPKPPSVPEPAMSSRPSESEPHDELPRELVELGRRIAALPKEHYKSLEGPFEQVVDCVRRRRRILSLVQEALSQLRLDVKYLVFDLDVTRKERDELRAQLDATRDEFE